MAQPMTKIVQNDICPGLLAGKYILPAIVGFGNFREKKELTGFKAKQYDNRDRSKYCTRPLSSFRTQMTSISNAIVGANTNISGSRRAFHCNRRVSATRSSSVGRLRGSTTTTAGGSGGSEMTLQHLLLAKFEKIEEEQKRQTTEMVKISTAHRLGLNACALSHVLYRFWFISKCGVTRRHLN